MSGPEAPPGRRGRGPSPAERVRARVRAREGAGAVPEFPRGYQRLGQVLLLRLPEGLRPWFAAIGEAWIAELGVRAVLRYRGGMAGEMRVPEVELIAGSGTVTEVVEHGIRYRLDAALVMFARGNRTERQRVAALVRPGETVVDLFAGIGYFALPVAVHGRAGTVYACEVNPTSYRYLVDNVALNRVTDRVLPLLGDNRAAALPAAGADRVVMGYLPSSLPWLPVALRLARPSGATLHVHLIEGTRDGPGGAESRVRAQLGRLGATVRASRAREVKPYGPGRFHAVVDVDVRSSG